MAKMREHLGGKAKPARASRPRGDAAMGPGNQVARYPEKPPFEFKTDLARRLWELRQQNIMAGAELLDWDGLNREMARRRGQRTDLDAD